MHLPWPDSNQNELNTFDYLKKTNLKNQQGVSLINSDSAYVSFFVTYI